MDDSDYILFVLNHWGGISGMMMLRMIKHADKKAVLLVPEYVRRDRVLNCMLEKGVFDLVIIFDDRPFYKISTKEKLIEVMVEYFDGLFKKNKLNAEDASEVYISCDMTNSFAMYLLEKEKKFTICEISLNTTLLRSRYDGGFNDGWMGEPYYKHQKANGLLCGEKGNCSVMIYPDSDIDKIGKEIKEYVIFDFGDYSALNKDQINKIMSCFDVDISCFDSNIQLVLFSSRNMCNGHSVYNTKQSTYAFQLLLEYFGKSKYKRVIKPHPSDTTEDFKDYFPGAAFLNSDFPIEFIRLNKISKIPELLSITSSGADKISDLVGKKTEVGWIFYKIAPYLTRLDICYRLINKYTKYSSVNQSIIPKWKDLESKITRLFVEKNAYDSISFGKEGAVCYIRDELDTLTVKSMNRDAMMLFFKYDTLADLCLDSFIPIKIEFYPKKNGYFSNYVQWIYCYTFNPKVKKELEMASMRLSLNETGQEVSIQGFPATSIYSMPERYMKIISENIGGRTLVAWGNGGKMENDLYDAFGLQVTDRVFWNKDLVKGDTHHHFPWINDKKDKIYLICWNIKMDNKLSDYFEKYGFVEDRDFVLIFSPPDMEN